MDLRAFKTAGMVEVINVSGRTQRFKISEGPRKVRHHEIAPGDSTMIEEGYLTEVPNGSGETIMSVLDRLCGRSRKHMPPVWLRADSDEGQVHRAKRAEKAAERAELEQVPETQDEDPFVVQDEPKSKGRRKRR